MDIMKYKGNLLINSPQMHQLLPLYKSCPCNIISSVTCSIPPLDLQNLIMQTNKYCSSI